MRRKDHELVLINSTMRPTATLPRVLRQNALAQQGLASRAKGSASMPSPQFPPLFLKGPASGSPQPCTAYLRRKRELQSPPS